MPKPVTTQFQEFEFSNQEFYAATRQTELNLMLLQTLAAQAAQRKLDLKIDLSKPKEEAVTEFIQREAEILGEIGAYNHLINLHVDTKVPETEEAGSAADIVERKPVTFKLK